MVFLCSDLTIITRHGDSQVGHKLDYDHNGNLTRKLACARQVIHVIYNFKRKIKVLVKMQLERETLMLKLTVLV